MNRLLLSVLPLIQLAGYAASTTSSEQGDKAPLLQATKLLQAPAGTKLNHESVQGKVVVLEFWATWCGPCVAAIAHLNELAEKFKDQPVQFIAITAEEEAIIVPFLKKRPMKAWVALDTDKAMNRAYGIVAIPRSIILGKDGMIAANTHPEELTEQLLKDVLAGRRFPLSDSRNTGMSAGIDPAETSRAQPLFQVLVRASSATNSSSIGGGGRFTARGYTLWELLPRAFDEPMASSARMLTNTALPSGRFDFVVCQPKGSDSDVSALLQQGVKAAFGLVGRKETREVNVLLLKVKRANAPGLVVSPTPGGTNRTGRYQGNGLFHRLSGNGPGKEPESAGF